MAQITWSISMPGNSGAPRAVLLGDVRLLALDTTLPAQRPGSPPLPLRGDRRARRRAGRGHAALPAAAGEPLAIRFRPGGLDAIGRDGVAVARARAIDGVDLEPRQPRPGLFTSVFEPDATVPNRDGVVAAEVVWDALASTPPPGGRACWRGSRSSGSTA